MTLNDFWNIIDLSWKDSPELEKLRQKALKTNDPELLNEASAALEDDITNNYTKRLAQLDKDELTAFIHILEERLYNIDREDVHEYTDGSDDGFLYARCFIVGMGQQYYDGIDKDPAKATDDGEGEGFGFSAYGVYDEKFSEEFVRYSVHSIESGSNREAWS